MSRSKKIVKTGMEKVAFADYRFLRLEMTMAEADTCSKEYLPNKDPMDVLEGLAQYGYKLSLGHDNFGQTHMVSYTCVNSEDANAGLVVTGRARDLRTAVLVLGFKVLVLLGDDPWAQTENERGGGYRSEFE